MGRFQFVICYARDETMQSELRLVSEFKNLLKVGVRKQLTSGILFLQITDPRRGREHHSVQYRKVEYWCIQFWILKYSNVIVTWTAIHCKTLTLERKPEYTFPGATLFCSEQI